MCLRYTIDFCFDFNYLQMTSAVSFIVVIFFYFCKCFVIRHTLIKCCYSAVLANILIDLIVLIEKVYICIQIYSELFVVVALRLSAIKYSLCSQEVRLLII